MSAHLLSIKDLNIAYGNTPVVHNFSLDIMAGEFVSLLGPSGCGKTTILRAIAGFIGAQSGHIILNGKDITHEPAEKRDVGIVFQNYALFPTMSAYENIAFGLRVAKTPEPEIKKRVTDIASASGILEHLQKRPAEMSGGQQQRVAIARALIRGANVLLFDEPLSNLDAKIRLLMRKEIKRLQEKFGFTAFFVTHDQDEALALSDRIVVLRGGRIEQVGTGRALYQAPANPTVCAFLGAANHISKKLAFDLTGTPLEGLIYVRPEDLLLYADPNKGKLVANVSHIEYLGAQVSVECRAGDETLTVALFGFDLPQNLTVGDKVGLTIRPNAWHAFPEAKA